MGDASAPVPDEYDLDDGPWVDCWDCGGEGRTWDCIDGCCADQDDPYCPYCSRACSVCRGKGGWLAKSSNTPSRNPATPEAGDA